MPEGQGIPYAKHPPGITAKKRGRERVENMMGTQWEQKKPFFQILVTRIFEELVYGWFFIVFSRLLIEFA
jgi:hypothetical protein